MTCQEADHTTNANMIPPPIGVSSPKSAIDERIAASADASGATVDATDGGSEQAIAYVTPENAK